MGTFIVLAAILAMLFLAVRHLVKKGSCACNCGGSGGCSACCGKCSQQQQHVKGR
ncbi:MAG TPA: FeoB-associated Cys-rich membrane protein [Ruminococcaceae bacterium]|nr:FeoB-associated Cys-rich membrane protein [Oscillospiraceae bacterium]